MNLSDLKPNPENPRKISKDKLAMLKKSLDKFGDLSGFVYNRKTKRLVGGHQRQTVLPPEAKVTVDNRLKKPSKVGTVATGYVEIGSERFNYREVEWDVPTEKAANIAANQHGGEWDLPKLGEWLKDLSKLKWDMELTGFDETELIDVPGYQRGKKGLTEDDSIPTKVKARTKPGDLYQLGAHRLLCGDSTNTEQVNLLMKGDKADLVFTDPPYGVDMTAKNKLLNAATGQTSLTSGIVGDDLSVEKLKPIIQAAFNNIESILADVSCYYIAAPQGGELGLMMMMQEAGIPCRHMIVWVKNAPVFSLGRLDYDYQHEPLLFGWSPKRTHLKSRQLGQWTKSIWTCDRAPNKLHPTMKPVDLPVNAIENSCPNKGIVVDLFGGSGSTMIAAEKTGRSARLMEIDPQYCDVIVARWEAFTGKKAVLQNGLAKKRLKR